MALVTWQDVSIAFEARSAHFFAKSPLFYKYNPHPEITTSAYVVSIFNTRKSLQAD
jgi:hypothetical protein